MNNNTFSIRYRVLKPDQSINNFYKAFRDVQLPYQLAVTPSASIRKYHFSSKNIEQMLQTCEWRLDAGPQVVHSYFVRLTKPKPEMKTIDCEVLIEHMQVLAKEMNRLIIQECLYLMTEAAKGYSQLISKFRRVSVSSSTIGLNSQGQCIVWLNQDLCALGAGELPLTSETDIVIRIIQVVKGRCEPISETLLKKIIDEVQRKQLNLQSFITYLKGLAASMKIILPKTLKYMVNQHKIIKNIQKLRTKTENIEQQNKNSASKVETKRFCPVRTPSRQNTFAPQIVKAQQRNHRLSQANPFESLRATSSYEVKKFLTEKSINMKKDSYLSTNMSSVVNSDKKWEFRKTTSNERNGFNFHFSKSRERTVISKCKSYEGKNDGISIINAAKPLEKLKFNDCNIDEINRSPEDSCNGRTSEPNANFNWQFSDRANSFRQKECSKVETRKVYRSFVIEQPRRIEVKNKSIGEECEQHQSSPYKDNVNNSIAEDAINDSDEFVQERSEESEEKRSKIQECLKANQWTKTLDSHQLWLQSNLNTSITLGQERSTYLDDVKLQKLQQLSRQMAASRLPHEDFYPLLSQTIIQ